MSTKVVNSKENAKKNKRPSQKKTILNILNNIILNSRQIYQIMNSQKSVDLSSVRRAITELLAMQAIYIKKKAPCPITGRKVRYYSTVKHNLV